MRTAWKNGGMSMLNRPAGAAEVGETVASVREYEAAQKLVSKLIAAEVPARDIAIVGMGVRTIERVTGRLGYANAARSGAINGVLIGLFLSAIFVLGNPVAPIQAFVGVLFVGVAMGMILSLVTYAIVRRRRDYASVMQLAADHYEVTVQAGSLAKARKALGAGAPAPRPAPVVTDEPPRYGERVAPGTTAPAAPSAPAATPAPSAAPAPASDEPPRYGERIAPPPPAAIPPRPADPQPAASEPSGPDEPEPSGPGTPADDAPVAEAPRADAPAADAPAEDTPAGEAPASDPESDGGSVRS